MIKKIVVLVITFLYFFHCFAFEIDTNFSTRSPHDVIKIDDRIGMRFGDYYQIRNLKDYNLDSDGWYSTSYCGTKMYVIYGSNYFLYHSLKDEYYPNSASKFNFGSSFLKENEYNEYIKDKSWWDLNWNSTVFVPDYLEEFSKNGKIIYDTYDVSHFYYFCHEVDLQLFKYNAIPWVTSEDPINMKIEVNLLDKTNSLVILNGYVHPDKRYLYKANRRIKRILITSPESDFSIISDFEDVVHFHEIKLPENVKTVIIEILDYYEGNKYKDLCVQMIGKRNFIDIYNYEFDSLSFDKLSYGGNYKEYKE